MAFEKPTMSLRFGSGSEASAVHRSILADGRLQGRALPTFEEVVTKYPAFAGATSVYASGSVVQGWGHANSDLDLYVVTSEPVREFGDLESFERRVSTTDPVIHIVLGEFEAFRADIEMWSESQVDEIIGRFAGASRDQEAPNPDKTEQELLHRLTAGQPLTGGDWWASRSKAIHDGCYGLWLAESQKLTAECFLEDAGGLLVSGDHESAAFTAREAFAYAVEALLATYGDYSVARKWLYRRLLAAQPTQISVEEAWRRLTFHGAHDELTVWAEETARLAQRLLLTVERKFA